MNVVISVCLALLFPPIAKAQLATGADALGRCNAVVADTLAVWSGAVNPANTIAIASVRCALSASLASSPSEPTRAGAVVIVPLAPVVLVATAQSSGVPSYRESIIDVAVAGSVSPTVSASIRMGFHSLTIDRYGAASSFTIDLGARAALLPQLAMGMTVGNVTAATVGASRTPLPRDVRFGISMIPHPLCVITADAMGRIGEAGAVSIGAHIQLHPNIAANIGVSSEPSTLATGIECSLAWMTVSYAYAARPDIGGLQTISAAFIMTQPTP